MRIVAGKFRGKNLVKSDHLASLRPTTDKNRQALFNILSSAKFISEIGFEISGAEVLDLCCGTGAVGFEALSRGAKAVTLIDNNLSHLEIVKKNAVILGVEKEAKILHLDAKKLPQNQAFFDLVFVDPPYAEDYGAIIENLYEKNWIKKTSLIVVEFEISGELKNFHPKNFPLENLYLLDLRRYGKTAFAFLKVL
jgi:16S rRNA (guanine966-N2)-methyltransferase